MLPDYDTCRKHITAFKQRVKVPRPGTVTFQKFWKYKTGLETAGHSVLDEENIKDTASMLRSFLIYFGMGITGVAEVGKIEHILRNIRPYYDEIRRIPLGSGKIHQCRSQLECIYERLGGIANNADYTGSESSITGKSKTLLAIWGQTPGFDSLTRERFSRWTHPPAPLKLHHLRAGEIWYEPTQFCDMIEDLDKWVLRWPESNNGRVFADSFSDLCPGLPMGRIIDMIYNWKLSDPRVDQQVGSRGS
jgi:hypothetical protein